MTFYNPYGFAPFGKGDKERGVSPERGHARFDEERFSGTLTLRLRTKTPLLIVDPDSEKGSPHKEFSEVIKGSDGFPSIPITSLKGVLRSAYECITESRMGVASSAHSARLGFRADTGAGARVVPAQVVGSDLRLFAGHHQKTDGRQTARALAVGPPDKIQCAAWVSLQMAERLSHGTKVACWIETWERFRWDRKQNKHVFTHAYYKVRDMVPIGTSLPPKPSASREPAWQDGKNWHGPAERPSLRQVEGVLVKTHKNMKNKHDERVFFAPVTIQNAVTEKHKKDYHDLISDYQRIHKEEIEQGVYRPPALKRYEDVSWSRHIMNQPGKQDSNECDVDGKYVYALLNQDGSLDKLYPVMISREVYELAPSDMMPDHFRPAQSFEELSPADRVFGWAPQKRSEDGSSRGHSAWKGQVRIGRVRCLANSPNEALTTFKQAVPLAILGQAKPTAATFYLVNQNGQPPQTKAAGYTRGQQASGQKRYINQNTPDDYWSPGQGRTLKEWQHPNTGDDEKSKTSQNRSIKEWVKPGVEFEARLKFNNLSKFELAALIFLAALDKENAKLGVGGGKPLGFGSMEVTLIKASISTGAQLKDSFLSLSAEPPTISSEEVEKLRTDFVADMASSNALKGFLAAARGVDVARTPVHYPRKEEDKWGKYIEERGDQNFEWFRVPQPLPQLHRLAPLRS